MHDYNADRYKRGLEILQQVGGTDYDAPINALRDYAPALARFTVEFAYGDVMARPELNLRTRQLCTVAALAALGTASAQLRYHINGARNVGVSPEEIIEVTILTAVYAGFPAALNGVAAARDVFRQRGETPPRVAVAPADATLDGRRLRGVRTLERVSRGSGTAVIESLKDIAPDLGRFILEFSYGDVISRTALDDKVKELATIAMCTALGTAEPQLKVHVNAALNVGATHAEIVEVIQQMAVYAGFPAALNGIAAARAVFAERTNDPSAK